MELTQYVAALNGYSNEALALKRELSYLKAQRDAKLKIIENIQESEQKQPEMLFLDPQVKALQDRSEVLKGYVKCCSSEEFEMNRLTHQNDQYVKSVWDELSKIHASSKLIQEDLESLKSLKAARDELRAKAQSLLAPEQ